MPRSKKHVHLDAYLETEEGTKLLYSLSQISEGLRGLQDYLVSSFSVKAAKSAGILVEEDKKGKKVSRKKAKDPNAPKRATSAYLLFQNTYRTEIAQNHPEYGPKDILQEISKKWGEASDAEKQPFFEENERQRKRYYEESALYRSSSNP